MFRRTFWFTAGAAAGVWATTKVNRKLRKLTPDSLAAQAAVKAIDTGHRLKDFALDVRAGMAQRETELAQVLGLKDPKDPLPPGRRPAPLAPPRRPGSSLPPAPPQTGDPTHTAYTHDKTTGSLSNRRSPGNTSHPGSSSNRSNPRNEDH